MSEPVLDYSFSRPNPKTIADNGFKGVLRYLSPNAGKNLEAGERDALRGQGLAIGLVWEWYAKRAVEGREAGIADAHVALNQANALGFPANLPIYLAVDWDAAPGEQQAINDYIEGAKSVDGRFAACYAGYWVIKRLFDAGIIKYGWQTYAWSGGNWDPRAQLRQTQNGQWGGSVDFGEAINNVSDAGLWPAGAPAPNPTPAPAPMPVPNGTHGYQIQSGDTFWGLEAKNGWTHGTLQALNPGVEPTRLQIGQTIQVPGGNTPAPQPAPGTHGYQIKAGDTFWGLEAANGWPHGTLQGLNPGVVATSLQIGQTIQVPGGGASPAVPTTHQHTIKSGETFWGLETANGWGHGTLQSLNPGVEPTKLQIGQVIKTP